MVMRSGDLEEKVCAAKAATVLEKVESKFMSQFTDQEIIGESQSMFDDLTQTIDLVKQGFPVTKYEAIQKMGAAKVLFAERKRRKI